MGDWLSDDPRINCVTLTGSTEVGIKVAQTAAKHLHRTCLELGGNDAFVILPDTDMDLAIQETVAARLSNAGQTCCASKRFIVHNSIKEQYINRLVDALKDVKLGDPKDENTECAPLSSKRAAVEVENQIKLSVEQGGKIRCGGKRFNESFIEPTVLEATKDMDAAQDMEIFGPVFTVIGYDTTDEAIEIANNSQYGLSSGVLGNNIFELMKVAKGMQAGACIVNGSSLYRCADEGFGGYKKSGLGKEGGKYTLEEMSQIKTIVLKKSF
jgi:acyl-CoA reductase-like NAD-dependent aldehyde dehydrogenase